MNLQFAIFKLTFHDFHRVFHDCIFYYMNYPDRVSTKRFCSPNRKYVVTSKVFRFNCMVVKMWTELWPQRGKNPYLIIAIKSINQTFRAFGAKSILFYPTLWFFSLATTSLLYKNFHKLRHKKQNEL